MIAAPSFILPAPGGSNVSCLAAAQAVPTPPQVINSCDELVLPTGPAISANPVCSGQKTYGWTYTDCSGNAATWVYTYTIAPPSITLPAPAGSTVNCSGTQVVPAPPAVIGSCGNPLTVTGPEVSPGCTGTKTYTWTYTDCGGNAADWVYTYTILPEPACDVKMNNCIKYELLGITKDGQNNHSFRVRVTNNCSSKLSYFAVQLPNGVIAKAPLNNAIITSESGRNYKVRNPNFSPFYSVRFSSQADSISGGQSEIFEYKLPPQSGVPTYIHVIVRLEPQVFYEAHLNTFGCDITQSGNRQQEEPSIEMGAVNYSIYPNPNTGNFSLELPESAIPGMSFRIIDITGKEMSHQDAVPGNSVQTFLASELPAGLYFLQIISEEKLLGVEKFVKQ